MDWANWESVGRAALELIAAVAVGAFLHFVVFRTLALLARRRGYFRADEGTEQSVLHRLRGPSLALFILLALQIAHPDIEPVATAATHLLTLLTYAATVWLLVAAIAVSERLLCDRYDVTVADNLEARRVHTRIAVMARALMVLVIIVGAGAALMTLPRVRELGAALLASAGIAGLVLGLAARPVLENLLAGLQIALTQPIRLDDVVVIDGEWGRIEEIASTFVVVRCWDNRRLMVPFGKIIGDTFQNWTHRSAEILGTVFIYTDYRCPVESIRKELRRLAGETDLWDGRVCALQVTGATEHSLELRALLSARDSGTAWELRVLIREQIIGFLQREHPSCLPRSRLEIRAEEKS